MALQAPQLAADSLAFRNVHCTQVQPMATDSGLKLPRSAQENGAWSASVSRAARLWVVGVRGENNWQVLMRLFSL
ncbi:hypothetical protein GQ600_6817 [Phytophthora cactorum]|nr:hypothetical protein GQ600_6817 [Phytophthora cactorum]